MQWLQQHEASDDIKKPLRGQSAYWLFCNDNRRRLQEANPTMGFGGVEKLLSKRFESLDASERATWTNMAVMGRERHAREEIAWKDSIKKKKTETSALFC
jgi:hypothetical protein